MHTSQRSSMVGRTFLIAAAVSTLAACDRSGSPLAPADHGAAPEAAARIATRPAASRGVPMTREEARKRAIEHTRNVLARARSGGITGLSDGRTLKGADAVDFWERTLRALESGSSLLPVWRSSPQTASASMEAGDGSGYVAGNTLLTRDWSWALANAWTLGSGADYTHINGTLEVYLTHKNSPTQESKSLYQWYLAVAQGDQVTAETSLHWDYNWYAEWAFAVTTHTASYADHDAHTMSSALQ